jgi:hypothetical protein
MSEEKSVGQFRILTCAPYYFKYWPELALIDVYKFRKRVDVITVRDGLHTTLAASRAAEYLAKKLKEDHRETEKLRKQNAIKHNGC